MASSSSPTLRRVASGTPSPGSPAVSDSDDVTRVAPLLCRTQRVPHTRRPDAGGSAVMVGNGGGPGGSAARLKSASPPQPRSTAKAAAAVTAPPRGLRRLRRLFGKAAAASPPPTAGAAAPAGGSVQPAGGPPRVLPPGGGRGGWRPRRKSTGAVAPRGATPVVVAPAGGGGGAAAPTAAGATQGTRVEVPVVDPRRGDPAFRRTVSWVTGTAAAAAVDGGVAPPANDGAADAEEAAVVADAGGSAQGETTGEGAPRTEPLLSTPMVAPLSTVTKEKEEDVEVAGAKETAVAPVDPNEASVNCEAAAATAPPVSVADKVTAPAPTVDAAQTETIGAATAGCAPTLPLPPSKLPPMPPLPEEEAVLWGGVDVPAAAPFPSAGPPPGDEVTSSTGMATPDAVTPSPVDEVATSAGCTDAPVDGCGGAAGGGTATNGAASPPSQTLAQTTPAVPLVTLLETQERAEAGDGAAAATDAPPSTALDSVAATAGGTADGALDGRGDGVGELSAATDSEVLPQPKVASSPQTEPLEALLELQEQEEADGSGAVDGEPATAAPSTPTGAPLLGDKPCAPSPRRSATDGVAAATGTDEDGGSASSAAPPPQPPSPSPTTTPPLAPSPSPMAPLALSSLPEEEAAVGALPPPGVVAPVVVPQTPPTMQAVPLMTLLELQEQEEVDEIEVAVPAAQVAPAGAAASAVKSCATAARRSATDVMATAAGSDGDGTSASSAASPSSRPPSPQPPSTVKDEVEVAPAPAGLSSPVTTDDVDGVCPQAPQPVVPLARSPTPDRPEGPPMGTWLSHTVLGRAKERFDALMARLRAAPAVQRPPQANRGFLRLPRWARRPSTV